MNKRYNSIIHGYTKSAPKRVKAKQAKQLARQARQTSLPLGGRSVKANDGLVFDLPGIAGERIREDAHYEGVRVRASVSLDGARTSLRVDIGFGDAVEPAPKMLEFPTLLTDASPILRAYPPEAAIAEKFHAMAVLGIANSRLKDFFDVWTLAMT